MSNIENLQSEFENLIAELEKLKSVNEFAATNTESSQAVIVMAKELATRIDKFEIELKKSYKSQSGSLNTTIRELKDSAATFEESLTTLEKTITAALSAKMDFQIAQINGMAKNLKKVEDTTMHILSDQKKHNMFIHNELIGFSKKVMMLLMIITGISSFAAICSVVGLILDEQIAVLIKGFFSR